jgi:hypothetical protein
MSDLSSKDQRAASDSTAFVASPLLDKLRLIFKSLIWVVALSLIAFIILIFWGLCFRNSLAENICDYQVFWAAGNEVRQGRAATLYQYQPLNPANDALQLFWYPPATAGLCAPLSLLPLSQSFRLFEIVLMLGIFWNAYLFAKVSESKVVQIFFKVLILETTFWPLAMAISVGQPGLLMGLIPMTAAYAAVVKRRYMFAGAVLCIALLKPQFLLPIFCILSIFPVLWLREKKSGSPSRLERALKPALLGFGLGALVNVLFSIAVLGPECFSQWSSRINATVTFIYGHTGFHGYREPFHLIASVPMALSFQWRGLSFDTVKNISSLICLTIGLIEFLLLFKIADSNLSRTGKINLMTVSTFCALPLMSPYLRIYDLTLLILPGSIILFAPPFALKPFSQLRAATIALWSCVDLRILFIPQELSAGLTGVNMIFVSLLAVYWLYVTIVLWRGSGHKASRL